MVDIVDPFKVPKIVDPFTTTVKEPARVEPTETKSDAELFREVMQQRSKPVSYGEGFWGHVLPGIANTATAIYDLPSNVALGAMRSALGLGQLGEKAASAIYKATQGGDKESRQSLSDLIAEKGGVSPSDWALNQVNAEQKRLEERAGSGVRWIPKTGEFLGEAFANPLTRTLGAKGVVGGTLSGAGLGLMAPTETGLTDEQYWNQKAWDVPVSGILGGTMGAVLREPSKEIAKLAEAGVEKLPLGFLGSGWEVADKLLKLLPGVKGAVKESERAAIGDLNRAFADKALEPLGLTVPKALAPGHPMNEYVQKKIGNAYDTITPKIKFDFSPSIEKSLRDKAAQLTDDMTPESTAKFYSAFDKLFENVGKVSVTPGTGHVGRVIPGETYREIESRLGKMATEYMNGNATAGSGLFKLQDTLRKELRDQNPAIADELRSIHNAYRNSRALAKIDKNTGAVDVAGTMTPGQLASLTNRTRMGGVDNELRNLAEAANTVMGKKGVTPETSLGPIGQVAVPGSIGASVPFVQHAALTPEMGAGALAALLGGYSAGRAANSPISLQIANRLRQTAPESFITMTPQMAAPLSGGTWHQQFSNYTPNPPKE